MAPPGTSPLATSLSAVLAAPHRPLFSHGAYSSNFASSFLSLICNYCRKRTYVIIDCWIR